jgi:Tol biopolymer transport system component/DNA-binding winged helix-turn-helix (wHTH) protein
MSLLVYTLASRMDTVEVTSRTPKIFRFGLYEVDLAAMHLRKAGVKIKLQEQPFQILTLLLERPGEIVTREELQKRLWPEDTFVVFDVGLNSAVKKLRQALGDDSENPRFIETLYRRGYRFLAPVESELPAGPLTEGGNGQTPRVAGLPVPRDPRALPETRPTERARRNQKRLLTLFVSLASITLAAYLGFRLRPPETPQITGYLQITHDGRQKHSMMTDGERLFIDEHGEGGRFVLEEVSATGGESAPVLTPFENTGLAGIARDGSALFVSSFKNSEGSSLTWALPLPAGAPRRLVEFGAQSVTPAPEGTEIFIASGADLYVTDNSGQNPRKLLTMDGYMADLVISPDGRRLRFTLEQIPTGSSALWEARRDGSDPHPLFPGSSDSDHECCGKWTPDGEYFVFESFRAGHNNIWVLPERAGWFDRHPRPVQLTNGPLDFFYPVPSKDGKKIFALGVQPRSELIRYEAKSGFTPFLGGMSISDVDFSRDGKWITYVSIPDRALWRSKLDGSDRLQLTNPGTMWAGMPRWSPDGKQIVFMGRTWERNWRAYLISSYGGTPQDLLPGAKAGFDPNWSADGKSIVLSLENLGAVSQGITILDLETKHLSDLPGAEHLFSPRWSPDGKYIAGISTDSEKLLVFELATRKWTEVANMPIGYPSWSSDSQYLYFDSGFTRDPAFFRVRISDHKLEELADLKRVQRYWGEFGEWAGLATGDTPLLTRNASSQEVYALDWNLR